ncbi:hypothetical protein GMLC_01330 [Geomonas limicola]|uniref:N-acetyltransferase domain-containing protein n=1 Tax=Geomonas limicola TaxID=2740186 RepID=A0A6V8N3K3_9BACT|nr:hypothetical protein [Geomonas limicola]GFO66554.1 hypothetical protein GMLC_01330 [Geomonas limicola]
MNLRHQLDRYGYVRTGFDIMLRLLYRFNKGQILNCYGMPEEAVLKPALSLPSELRHGFLEPAELLDLIDPVRMTMDREFACRAFAKGDRCYGVLDGTTLVHFSWFAVTPTVVTDGFSLRFPETGAYLYNAYTDTAYRGRQLFPFAVQQAMRFYLEQGYEKLLTIIAANNFGSINGVVRIGFLPVGRFVLLPVHRRVLTSGGCHRHGIRLEQCL